MNPTFLRWVRLAAGGLLILLVLPGAGQEPKTGPQTEKRFPPLKVPAGFKATLFACDPLAEYPSAVALGPKNGSVFIAVDYMTGLGTEIVRRDEIRLLEDTDGDGYADKSTVFAKGFNSIMGLAYHDGSLYVMHAPYLTALRDTKGTGTADERKDLLSGLGLTPEQNPVRLHCANGVVAGHDGWLYLAMGDNGIDVPRPEGDRLVHHGGGILRCRTDGRDLHLFATGTRNIYDVALDDELNVFFRDNENDGGTYMIRDCHSFWGADHGYPYLYEARPDEALPPLADLGRGSSAGAVCYLETQFPPEYRGNFFACEWGRSVVRCKLERAGSAFAPAKEIEFAAGAENDPYGFHPTDLIVQRDGSMIVVDWCDGQRPKRGRGRVYHIAYVGEKPKPAAKPADLAAKIDSESYLQRLEAHLAIERQGGKGLATLAGAKLGVHGRMHLIWLLARSDGPKPGAVTATLLDLAKSDPDIRVRAQAVRALADLGDPVLVKHKLDAGPGDPDMAQRLADLAKGQDPRVVLEVVIALGRLRWEKAPAWLKETLTKPDPALAHAAMQALRRSENWPAVLRLLDEPAGSPIRAIALRALADRFQPAVVDDLIARLRTEKDPARRREYAELLARVYKKPGPWVYWGYRPGPKPAGTVAWERTEPIEEALNRVLADPDPSVRLAAFRRMQREKVPTRLPTLATWLKEERQAEAVAVLLDALREFPPEETRGHLSLTVQEKQHTSANRLQALALLTRGLGLEGGPLPQLAEGLEDGPVLAEALRQLGKFPKANAAGLLLGKVKSPEAAVRAAAIEALGELRVGEARPSVLVLLGDKDVAVRRSAAAAAGKLEVRAAIEPLLKLARDEDAGTRRACLDSLRLLREPKVVPLAVAALDDRQTELKALECLADLGGPEQAAAVAKLAKGNPSAEVLTAVVRVLTGWGEKVGLPAERRAELDKTVAEIHGASGVLTRWQTGGPLGPSAATALVKGLATPGPGQPPSGWRTLFAAGTESRLNLGAAKGSDEPIWLAYADVAVPEPTAVEFLASSGGTLRVWLNGKPVHDRKEATPFRLDADRFGATLAKGNNRLLLEVAQAKGPVEFHLRFRRKSAVAEHEKLTQAALGKPGNVERGRQLFFNAEKSQCVKCHRLADQGEHVGPDLTGIGGRFRIHLVESILEPSRTIAPSFGTFAIALKNGKVLNGVKMAETETTLIIGDNQGQKTFLPKADIDEIQPQPTSTMPEELEKKLTADEFVDLIAFLVSQKDLRGK